MKRLILFTLMICLFLFSNNVYANPKASEDGDILSKVVCNIVLVLSGPISQAIATLIIIITGYSFFVGKVSIGMLMIVAAGIMFVFGAQTIMGWILGNETQCVGGNVMDDE